MKVHDFLDRIPESFAVECLEALPAVDRKRLLQAHNARVKVGPGSLRRKDRMTNEARKLRKALLASDDIEDKRSLFQGWLAHRAPIIIGLLESWEIDHQGGFVEDFDWVKTLDADKVRQAVATVREAHPEVATDQAFLVYFSYLEIDAADEIFDFDAVFATAS